MLKNGVIAKPTQRNIIRYSPPLIINNEQLEDLSRRIEKSW
jgi:acetylornithine/succinyldiaminopimelate/putrescine aminotransferase